jgi:hypothetical protein
MIKNEERDLIGTIQERGLLEDIRRRAIVVPEFQREYLWARSRQKTTSLLASIAQGWPAGALLLMERTRGFHTKPVQGWKSEAKEGFRPVTEPKYSILDGQQRLTALYQSYYGRSKTHKFYIAVMDVANTDEIDPEEGGTFRVMGEKSWNKKYGDIRNQRADGVIEVCDFIDATAWTHWLDEFDSDLRAELNEIRERGALSGLSDYRFPVSVVLESAPDDVLASIFSTINEQGTVLKTFDLVVAKTIKRKRGANPGFNLRDEWDKAAGREASEEAPAIKPTYDRIANFALDPEVPLRLVRLAVDQQSKLSDPSIIGLKPTDVHQSFGKALETCENVLAFLEDKSGLIPKTLPDSNYLLPIAYVAFEKPAVLTRAKSVKQLLQWYWAAIFRTVFGRGKTGQVGYGGCVAGCQARAAPYVPAGDQAADGWTQDRKVQEAKDRARASLRRRRHRGHHQQMLALEGDERFDRKHGVPKGCWSQRRTTRVDRDLPCGRGVTPVAYVCAGTP